MIVVVFHSILGVRSGEIGIARYLAGCGHETLIVDRYDGQSFDGYETAEEHTRALGSRKLHLRATEAVADLRERYVVAGFSTGGEMAIEVAASHSAFCGLLLYAGAGDTEMMGIETWPKTVSVQVHYTLADPTRNYEWIDRFASVVRAADAAYELVEYPGSGHLFTDCALPSEYQPDDARNVWANSARFIGGLSVAPRSV